MLFFWLVGCGTNVERAVATPTPTPTLPPITITTKTQSYQTALDNYVARYVNAMSLDDRIGQMLYAQFNFDDDGCQVANPCIRKFHPGGMIVYQNQLSTYANAVALTSSAQANSTIPMLIGTDDEGGAEDRLLYIMPKGHPSALTLADTGSAATVYQYGKQMAKDNLAVGLNTDLAPVVDVPPACNGGCTNPRDFGPSPTTVSTYAGAWMQGLQDGGVIGTLKHFPGLGSAPSDPHTSLPTIHESRQQIEQWDLAPYRALINSNDPPGMIMSTDIMVPAIDPTMPAELSNPIITGILRNELHYNGVVITDALYMDGLGLFFTNNKTATAARSPALLAKIAILAIQAGDDMLLGTYDMTTTQAVVNGIKAALQNGQLTLARIDQSVARIIKLKMERGLIPVQLAPQPNAPQPAAFSPAQLPLNKP
jgi:beta-N-acetylhexosaminidase